MRRISRSSGLVLYSRQFPVEVFVYAPSPEVSKTVATVVCMIVFNAYFTFTTFTCLDIFVHL